MAQRGKQSYEYENMIYIQAAASAVGTKEGEGPLREFFDFIAKDDLLGGDTWEKAESKFVQKAVELVLDKMNMGTEQIRYVFAGDLLAQSIASSGAVAGFEIPLFGIYGACSTSGEGMQLASAVIEAGMADRVIAVTSSHFASAEKEFRYPLDYGSQRPLCATWTVTGSGAFLLSGKKCQQPSEPDSRLYHCRIAGITTGKIVDYGIKDSMNMGCCMAPAAADTIAAHLNDFHRRPEDYDKIVTGDLGSVGQTALFDLMDEKGYNIRNVHMDCGMTIYDSNEQDTQAGGSGCGCAATTCAAYLLRKIESCEWKRILFVPTGALLSKVSFNEGQTVPGIAHAVVIEYTES